MSRLFLIVLLVLVQTVVNAWISPITITTTTTSSRRVSFPLVRFSATSDEPIAAAAVEKQPQQEHYEQDYEIPEDAVVQIKPAAMKRLRELRQQQKLGDDTPLVLRMGVRSGGCSGMSYVMDFSNVESITEEDAVDDYPLEKIQCVVDAKSLLYLYGLELDYSEELIGGGFKFFNPNAEESCGCGSSFGV